MVSASFEFEGNRGVLTLVTHFDVKVEIECNKESGQSFRLGGTAINEVSCFEAVLLEIVSEGLGKFRAFSPAPPHESFDGHGILSPEWPKERGTLPDRHCFITEFYDLHVDNKLPEWYISRFPIKDANHLFVNLDVIDGGENIMKRYRVSPFSGNCRIM